MQLYWGSSCLFTALFVQQSNAGSVLTWQPQMKWFVDCYHAQCNNVVSGHQIDECRVLAGPSSTRVILAEHKQWIKYRIRTKPSPALHVVSRYYCTLPEVLQVLHFSEGIDSTCESTSACAQECNSNTVPSKKSWCKPDAASSASLGQPRALQLFFQGDSAPWLLSGRGGGCQFYPIFAACQQILSLYTQGDVNANLGFLWWRFSI